MTTSNEEYEDERVFCQDCGREITNEQEQYDWYASDGHQSESYCMDCYHWIAEHASKKEVGYNYKLHPADPEWIREAIDYVLKVSDLTEDGAEHSREDLENALWDEVDYTDFQRAWLSQWDTNGQYDAVTEVFQKTLYNLGWIEDYR